MNTVTNHVQWPNWFSSEIFLQPNPASLAPGSLQNFKFSSHVGAISEALTPAVLLVLMTWSAWSPPRGDVSLRVSSSSGESVSVRSAPWAQQLPSWPFSCFRLGSGAGTSSWQAILESSVMPGAVPTVSVAALAWFPHYRMTDWLHSASLYEQLKSSPHFMGHWVPCVRETPSSWPPTRWLLPLLLLLHSPSQLSLSLLWEPAPDTHGALGERASGGLAALYLTR